VNQFVIAMGSRRFHSLLACSMYSVPPEIGPGSINDEVNVIAFLIPHGDRIRPNFGVFTEIPQRFNKASQFFDALSEDRSASPPS